MPRSPFPSPTLRASSPAPRTGTGSPRARSSTIVHTGTRCRTTERLAKGGRRLGEARSPEGKRVQGKVGRSLTEFGERILHDPDPTWTKAPGALLRFRSVLVALAVAALVLGIASTAAPLFESAVAGAALSRQISESSRWSAGLSVIAFGPLTGPAGSGSSSAQDQF